MSFARLALGLPAAGLYLALVGPPRRLAQRFSLEFGRWAPVVFSRLLCAMLKVKVRRFGAASPAERRLVVANHVSWLDIPVLASLEPLTFLAKKEIGETWLGGQCCQLQGVVYVDRQRKRAIPKTNVGIVEAMRRGESVALFAEATTGDGNRILKFRSSHFEATRASAREAATVVQPVYLHFHRLDGLKVTRLERPLIAWYGDMTFWPHLLRIVRSGGVGCDVHYGEPIAVADHPDRKALTRAVEAAVRRLAENAWRSAL